MWRNNTPQQDAVNEKFMKAFAIPFAIFMGIGLVFSGFGNSVPDKRQAPAYQFIPKNNGIALYGSFIAYSKTCIPNQFMPKGEYRAIMHEIWDDGYKFYSNEHSNEVSQKTKQIESQLKEDPNRKTAFCKMWENHIDELLFGKGYKRG